MRRLSIKRKDYRRVAIPEELRDAMRLAWEMIDQAEIDPDIGLDYDDAIQAPHLCGGRIRPGKRPFVFTYYPTGDEERGRWSLTLNPLEIEDIADGRTIEIAMYCCVAPECRSKFREADQICIFCDFVEDPHYGRFPLADALPRLQELGVGGLAPTSSRADVQQLFGDPVSAGGGIDLPGIGYVRPWIKYSLPAAQLHFEFEQDGSIHMVNLMPLD